jgi:hypothetical protein
VWHPAKTGNISYAVLRWIAFIYLANGGCVFQQRR